jgi:hypothetical protein
VPGRGRIKQLLSETFSSEGLETLALSRSNAQRKHRASSTWSRDIAYSSSPTALRAVVGPDALPGPTSCVLSVLQRAKVAVAGFAGDARWGVTQPVFRSRRLRDDFDLPVFFPEVV